MSNAALADDLLEAVGLLRRHARRRVGRPWTEQEISPAQGELIRFVRRNPGTSVAAAAAELGVAANTVSTLVSHLVAAGLLERERDPGDRRVARLRLADPARRQVERWRDERTAVVGDALDRLTPAERSALAASLPAIRRLAAELRPEDAVHTGVAS